jgi:hypothetical protein
MGVTTDADAELEEITRDVAPEAVLDEVKATVCQSRSSSAAQRPVASDADRLSCHGTVARLSQSPHTVPIGSGQHQRPGG